MARVWMALMGAALMLAMPATGLPTPGLNGETTEQIPVVGRLFPEALETNDYIGYFEGSASLQKLNQEYPDRVELFEAAQSYGWVNQQTGQRESHPIWLIEVTNEQSEVAFDDKIQLLFMCSIHGNEKGGREGCMRVIEDFAKGIGMAEGNEELVDLLDYMTLIFILMNTDGWTHDEPEYYNGGTMMTRQNANGTDMNRNWPTMGRMAQDQSHKTLAEPETAGAANFMQERYENVYYASDIHGMLNPADLQTPPSPPSDCDPTGAQVEGCQPYATEFQQWLENEDKGHFLLGLLPAGQLTQEEQIRMTRLSELVKERTTEDCGGGLLSPTWCASPSFGAWGGVYNHWGTVWETINYQVSGGSHDWMLGDTGLNAPSLSFEMSYNHIVCDGVYPGCGAYMNDFHINTVRVIVSTFMEAAKLDYQVSIDSGGARTGYLFNPLVVSNVDENGTRQASGGWADINDQDDRWDVLHNDFYASPNEYFRDFAQYVADGDRPGVFDEVAASELSPERLANYDNFVVAGSAYKQLDAASKGMLAEWVEAGGNLILTDEALTYLADVGAVDASAINTIQATVGYTEILDYSHPLAKDLIGYSQQTYEPVPIGYQECCGTNPIWRIDTPSLQSADARVVGVVAPGNQRLDESPHTNLGEVPMGEGTIRFLGALLPDPTYEDYTPYGVASHGVTYAGNQYFINLLGFDSKFEAPPLVLEGGGALRKADPSGGSGASGNQTGDGLDAGAGSPGLGAIAVLAIALVAAALVAERRRRD